jgi:transcriptional regulator CtsR
LKKRRKRTRNPRFDSNIALQVHYSGAGFLACPVELEGVLGYNRIKRSKIVKRSGKEGHRVASLSNAIQQYLERLLKQQGDSTVEIRRNELAQVFGCSPSQINYVLETRFTTERGYIIESRRGGGGFVRIIRVTCDSKEALLELVHEDIGTRVSQYEAEHYIQRLAEEGFINDREAAVMNAAVDRDVIGLQLPLRDRVRARLLKNMVLGLLKAESGSSAVQSAEREAEGE